MTVPSHPAGTTRQQVEADTARIQADLLGLSHGHDPFVAAVRATRMPMIITDPRLPDNPVVFANDAFCRLTGYAREEILGLNCRFLQGPETDQAVIARIRAAIRAVQSIEVDIRNYRKDGSTFWNRLLLAPVRDAAGELAYFFASQLDVTMERERLAGLESDKAALVAAINDRHLEQEASERQLRFATEAGRLGIWRLDLETEELSASRRFKQHFGWNPDLPMRRADVYARMPPEDRVRATIAARDLVSPDGYIIEYRVNQPDGTLRWIEVRAQAEGAGRGNPRYLTGVSLDITERKASEHMARALADLDARLAVIDDPVELAFTAAQVLGETINVSRAGYGTVDLAAETIHIDRDWNAPGTNSLAGTLAFRDYGSYIEDLKRGETVIVSDAETDPRTSLTAAALKGIHAQSFINMPVTEHEGLVALLYLNHRTAREWSPEELSFIREVAQRARFGVERRRAEQALRELATSLESQVAARTDQLMQTEATLRQSQKMEAVGQLTGGLAHDFNNLLTGITGSLELLKIRVAQGRLVEVDRYIMAAEGAARRAAALTHRLLAFSRRQTLTPQSTDVNQLIAGMEELIRRTAGPGIQLDVVGSGGLWNTLVDQSQLENALLNLCINARDAMPNGGRITIETANRWIGQSAGRTMDGLAPGQYVALAVSDNGTGMSRETLAKAFDPFFTTKPIGQGTGLGLSMIYGFAQQSGGQARIYSELGQGTTVRLYLPRHRGETEQAETPAALDQAPRTQTGATVLIIDDEPTVRMLLSDVLRELGYRTIEATDGAAGLKVLQSPAPIDLLITDVGLPNGLNGRQVADAARHMRPDLKVLFITGYAENAVIEHGHLDPGMHVLTKPFTMEFLGSRVKELVG